MIFPEQIKCDNFIMKMPNIGFSSDIVTLCQTNQEHFKFLPFTKTLVSIEKTNENLKNQIEKWKKGEHFSYYIFVEKNLVGYVGIKIRTGGYVAEISYYLDKGHTGKGYISCAILQLESLFFRQGGHRCEIFCNERNTSSCAVAKRLNYRLDGTMREYELTDNKFCGIQIYSKLDNEANKIP